MRSRRVHVAAGHRLHGITSACAEQTILTCSTGCSSTDHLRVCGADQVFVQSVGVVEGSPPRVRSRRQHSREDQYGGGITSACAEQTKWRVFQREKRWDHLRVCGADELKQSGTGTVTGSPPRVRSRRCHSPGSPRIHGITSACAEQTTARRRRNRCFRGSPPRVRSRRSLPLVGRTRPGITSACAEQTSWRRTLPPRRRDHLRVCGADDCFAAVSLAFAGSPPRVRSRHL